MIKLNNKMNSDLHKYRIINKLKTVYRFARAGDRHESSAEHSWGALMLADYFMTRMERDGADTKLDRLKVYELIMYHDLVEIETGDIPMNPGSSRGNKIEIENAAAQILSKKLPDVLAQKYLKLFAEFQD